MYSSDNLHGAATFTGVGRYFRGAVTFGIQYEIEKLTLLSGSRYFRGAVTIGILRYLNHFLTAQGRDMPFFTRAWFSITYEQNINSTFLNGTTRKKIIICRQLSAGHMVGLGQ